jgi:DNA-3-methyladenine glycosylase I
MQQQGSSLDTYLWNFVDGEPLQNNRTSMADVPATTALSDSMAKDMKKRGFTFVGSTICYAFMQAAGLVNDHLTDCFRHQHLKGD